MKMLRRKRGWIGIDLGTHTIKVAQVECSAAGLRIAASALMQRTRVARTESDGGEDGERPGRDVMAALSTGAGFSGRTAACVLPMRLTDLHVLAIPPAEDAERRVMVAHELSSMIDGDEHSREFDYWETGPAAKANPSTAQDVNVLSVPRRMVSQVLSDLSKAKLRCRVMDGLPFALARAVKLAYSPDLPGVNNLERSGPSRLAEAPIAAIDWGYSSATFCVVSDGRPLFTRHLRNCGLTRLADAVSRAMGLPEDDAMELLCTYGMPGPGRRGARPLRSPSLVTAGIGASERLDHVAAGDDSSGRPRHDGAETREEISEMLAEVTGSCLGEMAEEIEKTLSYLRMQYPGILPERVCLFGSGAMVKNVPELLSESVRLPIEVWALPHSRNQRGEDPNHPPALLGTAVALSTLAWSS